MRPRVSQSSGYPASIVVLWLSTHAAIGVLKSLGFIKKISDTRPFSHKAGGDLIGNDNLKREKTSIALTRYATLGRQKTKSKKFKKIKRMSHHIAYRNVKGLGKIPEMVTEYFNYLQQGKNSVSNFIRFY